MNFIWLPRSNETPWRYDAWLVVTRVSSSRSPKTLSKYDLII